MSDPAAIEVVFVEDDPALREAIVQALQLEGFTVDAFPAAEPALRRLSRDFEGVVVSDVRLPAMDGLEFFDAIRGIDDSLPVIFTTGHGDVAMAVSAMKQGAADFLSKPYAASALAKSIRRAAEKRSLVIENRKLREALRSHATTGLLGSSIEIERLNRLIAEVGRADIDLMITGPSGAGKSFVARRIHDLSPRHDRPFVTIEAGSWAHQDAELIIFGREPGSGLSRAGLIERARGGTLFLDDIETMPEQIQARMLSVVEQRSYLPIGASRPQATNVRIISAARNVSDGDATSRRVSLSLFHRLNGVTIALPPLASRRRDIAEIFRHFVAEFEREFDTAARPLTSAEWHHLASHDWPGNMHELRGYARIFVLDLSTDESLGLPGMGSPQSLKDRVAGFERALIENTMRECRGRIAAAERSLGIPRKTLYDKLAKHGLKASSFRT
ncbi:sigma-54-dependent Fis family transcriptional regulator [Sphingorhabdus soli]|uniref:Sigma-54-dependent Fis family transcriptional regulator n=1 Tax=Flavisphingopyxis soli TaxID=2601267 RepID=A0A5C6ULM3_9SPHN|nr:sigma-54 dependent transcriptional regulator [Sphingorhabdus soli]TXC73759.1 sigma-54-dependent Fis family transcriptional regulator [Sphingorhabdus soli]